MIIRKADRATLAASSAAAALMVFAAPGYAVAQSATYSFDIPPQDISSALIAYGRASRQQLVFDGRTVRDKQSAGLTGDYSAEAGLVKLLAGTGLRAEFAGAGAVRIVAENAAPQSGSAAGSGAEVEALIVTAQKREEDIQDVPIAISAFTQEDLTRSQVAGGPDLMTQVPNMTFTKTNFTSYSIQIRGIGTQAISATTDAAVAVAFNNTPFIRNRFFEQEFYDLARVEVLRGPQGTLYGRNATAGVVNIISAKPKFNFEAKASGDVSNYNSTRVEGMVNIPLVEDAVALRLAGAWTKRDGYVTNELSGNPIDGRDLWSTRLSLRFAPSDRLEANLIWEHFEEDDDRLRSGKQLCKKHIPGPIRGIPVSEDGHFAGSEASQLSQGCLPASMYSEETFQTPYGYALPYFGPLKQIGLPVNFEKDPYARQTQSKDLRVIESMRDPDYRAQSDLFEFQVAADIVDGLTVSSETAYATDNLFSMQDFNRFNTVPGAFAPNGNRALDGNGVFCDHQIGCSDRLILLDLSTAQSTHFSQEVRLASSFEGPFNFSVGANFLRYDTEDKYYVFINTLSLWAQNGSWGWPTEAPPYVQNVSDNRECDRTRFPDDPRANASIVGCIYADPNPIGSLNDRGHNYFLSKNPYRLISYAAFGEAYYQATEALKITAGLRWTVDKKHAPLIPSWLIVAGGGGDYPVLEVIEQEWREPTGRLAIDWKPDLTFTDETLIYGSYARGYKAGGANPPPAVVGNYGSYTSNGVTLSLFESLSQPKVFDPEYVDAFEIGSKNTILDGAATVNLSAFYYDYQGYQISRIVNRSAVNANHDAKVWGIELEADWRPLENLRLGFKGGYQNTRVADGEKAIDLMDRTAGDPNYVVVRPFPTIPSNCILPVWFVTLDDRIRLPNAKNGHAGPCVNAFMRQLDPVTMLPYVPNPTVFDASNDEHPSNWVGYPGFDPASVPNNGEGIFKDLSGNELPNAPNFTATITADYTLPLPNEWLMTLHTDLYYQSEAWTRIFNMEGYDKLKAYSNVNVAAIFTNEDVGWKVMAYVKNVFDKDSITGAFLNSDDTGLTTNVFLTEPRLYGLRVTKDWTGGPLVAGFGRRDGAYPLVIEVGGAVLRKDAPATRLAPAFLDTFPVGLHTETVQDEALDWGDGREVKLTYAPTGHAWRASIGARFGRTNGQAELLKQQFGDAGCFGTKLYCDNGTISLTERINYSTSSMRARERHTIIDFAAGHDVGFGAFDSERSSLSLGLRYADLTAQRSVSLFGLPDWDLPDELLLFKYAQHHHYSAAIDADSAFEGAGPTIAWDASVALWGDRENSTVAIDWTIGGGVLFGRQTGHVRGQIESEYFDAPHHYHQVFGEIPAEPAEIVSIDRKITGSASVPTLNLSLGASYAVGGVKASAGYRWERYFDAIDGGIETSRSYDRTIDGPYFKIAVGFGG